MKGSKLPPGSAVTQFSITTWNGLEDMLRWWKMEYRKTGADPMRHFRQTGIVMVQNNSGTDRDRFDVLGIAGPIFPPDSTDSVSFENRVELKGVKPSAGTHGGRFVVLLEPLAKGVVGRACISGVCPVKIAAGNGDHGFADIVDDETGYLQAGHHGAAQILWLDDTGSSEEWAVVRLGLPSMFRWFELKGALTQGGYADAYQLDDTYTANEDVIFEVHDQPLGMFAGWVKETSYPAHDGARGLAMFNFSSGLWEVVQMQHLAHSITFYLLENMSNTHDGMAYCKVDDYYRGVDPEAIFGAYSLFVHDPQALFKWALAGAKGKATFDDRSNEYHITECDRIARSINFTTTEYIGETEAPYAEVTIDDFYHGQDPELWFSSPSTLRVKDPQGNFLRVLSGAKGKARFDDGGTGEYHIVECQQMSMMIKCTADDDYDAGETVGISVPVPMNPPDGMDPDGSAMPNVDPVANGVENNTGQPVKSGDTLFIAWGEEETQWELLIGADEPTLKWAKAQDNWEEAHAANGTAVDLHPHVSCKDCDRAGTLDDEGQDAFDVLLPRKRAKNAGLDPSVYTDDVILYRIDEEGSRVCETPYLFSYIGEHRLSRTSRILTGWQAADGTNGTLDMRGCAPIGINAAEADEDEVNDVEIGERDHGGGGAPSGHDDHSLETMSTVDAVGGASSPDAEGDTGPEDPDAHTHTVAVGYDESYAALGSPPDPDLFAHTTTDNRGPRKVVCWIERTS